MAGAGVRTWSDHFCTELPEQTAQPVPVLEEDIPVKHGDLISTGVLHVFSEVRQIVRRVAV